jgi:hypothetical protein
MPEAKVQAMPEAKVQEMHLAKVPASLMVMPEDLWQMATAEQEMLLVEYHPDIPIACLRLFLYTRNTHTDDLQVLL